MLTILQGDSIEQLRTLPDESVHCCVTSPPYWGLRDYSTNGQLGLEKTPEEYVEKMVEVFREVRRVLRKDGTLWLNLGDSFAANGISGLAIKGESSTLVGTANSAHTAQRKTVPRGLKPKDLVGIPWRVAFALQADGWWLRSDIIWAKPNPMPESVTDRPTKAHEYLFLLTKSANYFYDAEAIREQVKDSQEGFMNVRARTASGALGGNNQHHMETRTYDRICGANKRSVWTVATAPYPEAHFATYPPDLIKPCILAGTSAKGCCAKCGSPWERITESEKTFESGSGRAGNLPVGQQDLRASETNSTPDVRLGPCVTSKTIGWQPTCECKLGDGHMMDACTVLDPFAGSGTTGAVALELGRKAVLIELNPKYVELIKTRCNITPGLQLA